MAQAAQRGKDALQTETLLEALAALVCIVDDGGQVRFVNRAVDALLGYRPEGWVDRPLAAYVHPEDQAALEAAGRAILDGEAVAEPLAVRFKTADGAERALLLSGRPLALEDERRGIVWCGDGVNKGQPDHTREIEQWRRVADSLRDTLVIVNSGQPLEEILTHIVHQAQGLMGASACVLHQVDYDRAFVTIQARCGLPESLDDVRGFPLHSSRGDALILDRKPVVIDAYPTDRAEQVRRDPAPEPDVQRWRLVTAERYRAFLAVPLVIGQAVYGSLAFYFEAPQRFGDETLSVASAFAEQAALAIENARLYRAEQERRREVEHRRQIAESLRDTLRVLNTDRPLDEILAYVVQQARELMGAGACVLHQFDYETHTLWRRASHGWPVELLPTQRIELADIDADYQRCIEECVPVYSNYEPLPERLDVIRNDFSLEPDVRWRRLIIRERFAASMVLPIMIRERTYGALLFYYEDAQDFPEEQINLALTFVEQAALAIENARLHQAEQERRIEAERRRWIAESLRDTLKVLNSDRPLDEILDHVVRQARTLMGAGACLLHQLEHDPHYLRLKAACGWPDALQDFEGNTLEFSGPMYRQIIQERRYVHGNFANQPRPELARSDPYLDPVARRRRLLVRSYYSSWLGLPLIIRDEVYGSLTFYYEDAQQFPEDQIELASAFVEQAALAIENARLYQVEQSRRIEAEQRRRIAESLRDILAILNSKRPLEQILAYIVSQASQLLDSGAGAIFAIDREAECLTVQASYNLPEALRAIRAMPIYKGSAVERMLQREPYLISDIARHLVTGQADGTVPNTVPGTGPETGDEWLSRIEGFYSAYLGIPLVINGEVYGALGLYYKQPRAFSDEDLYLAVAFGDQASMAIENARLYDQAQEAAAVAERNRLARDLHNSVTQTLFSASLIAKVLPRLWDRDEQEGRKRLEELHQLTRGALAEMRTLLLELRPTAFAETELEQLLRHLVEAAIGRAGIVITLECEGERDIGLEVKMAVYRIVQETLNNIAKHADATEAGVNIWLAKDRLALWINDNGCGFDVTRVPPDHLGLSIMKERARSIGAELRIESQPGSGTQVTLLWREGNKGEE